MTDDELVRAVQAGDRDAFRTIVEREAARVYRCCYRVLGDAAAAEDAAQEAFTQAFRALGTYRGTGSLSAWLARIATRQALRQATRRRSVVTLDVVVGEATVDPGPEPLGRLVAGEEDRALREAVARLPEPYRETVAGRYFGELSIAELAQLTGRPEGTVKTHLHRGLARLRATLPPEVRR